MLHTIDDFKSLEIPHSAKQLRVSHKIQKYVRKLKYENDKLLSVDVEI